jgi:aminoglycoside phosphotransferase (APT) family kinase protein
MSRDTTHVPARQLDLDHLRHRLAAFGAEDVAPLAGGASSLTYSARADGRRVVVKVAPPGVPPLLNRDVLRQAHLIRALNGSAVPVPEVLWEDAGDPPDDPPLFVMSFVEGTSLEPLFDRHGDDSEVMVGERMRDAARTLGTLHALAPASLGLAAEPVVGPSAEVDRWCQLLETVDPALAPGWSDVASLLRRHEPVTMPAAVVHGDFRLGNLLAVGATVTAVIDWEIWSLGDPRIDLGWFLANADPATYQRPTRYADAVPPLGELLEVYAGALGRDVADLAWFQALACFKSTATWSLILKHNRRRDEPDPDVEAMTAVLPHLLARANELVRGGGHP